METEGRDLFAAYDIALPEALVASDAPTAVTCARELGYPVAMKVVSPDVIHKSDVGGVRLGLRNDQDVTSAFEAITENVSRTQPSARITGMLISPMVPRGVECIAGLIRDPQFGPTLMFGLGGVFVEVLKDVAFRVAPPTMGDIDDMIREIKGYPVLEGIRGDRPKDVGAVRDILAKLARMGIENPEIREVDLNPVIVHDQGASIVDVRVVAG